MCTSASLSTALVLFAQVASGAHYSLFWDSFCSLNTWSALPFHYTCSASDSLLRGNNKQSYMRVFKEVVKSASEFVVKLLIQLLIMLINVFIHIQTCTVPVHMLLIFWGVLSCISFVYNSLCSPVRGFLSSSLFFAVAKCICNWQAQQSFCCRIKKIIKIRAATCFPVPHFYFYLVS